MSPDRRRAFGAGFVSQAASAATNFGLSLLAARTLGPSGLGVVFIGFSCYLIALGLQRALVTDPLLAGSSALGPEARAAAAGRALTTAIGWATAATVLVALAGLFLPGEVGRGLLLFVPWLLPALVQDLWRMVLFRDGRGPAGAANDLVWLAGMALSVPVVVATGAAWAVVGCWGIGALAATVAGFFQTGARPARPIVATRWWRADAWPLGRWLGAESVVYTLGAQALTFALVLVLDTRAIGGIRAVQSIFAPLSVVGPALGLPGLPALARRAAVPTGGARTLAAGLGAMATMLTVAYVVVTALGRGHLLAAVFGNSFQPFVSLVWPIGAKELLVAPTLGFTLLLKAQRRGGTLLSSRAVASLATLALGSGLAVTAGVVGAAWGIAIGAALGSLTVMTLALRAPTPEAAGRRGTSVAVRRG
jgi:hypothetical protein